MEIEQLQNKRYLLTKLYHLQIADVLSSISVADVQIPVHVT